MSKKVKPNCCRKFRRKAKACKGCPLMCNLSKKARKKKLKKLIKKAA